MGFTYMHSCLTSSLCTHNVVVGLNDESREAPGQIGTVSTSEGDKDHRDIEVNCQGDLLVECLGGIKMGP